MEGRFRRWFGGASSALFLVCVVAPSSAFGASVGEIARAEVNSSSTKISIAGVVERTNGCPELPDVPEPPEGPEPPEDWEPPEEEPSEVSTVGPDRKPWGCGWIPFATIGPGSSTADCAAHDRRWDSIGEEVQLVWAGSELDEAGSAAFDTAEIPITPPSSPPLLCLSAVETFFYPGGEECFYSPYIFSCSIEYYGYHEDRVIDSEVLTPGELEGSPPPYPWITDPEVAVCRKARQGRRQRLQKPGRMGLAQRMKAIGQAGSKKRCKSP